MKKLVILPGGYHPYHAGHRTLYDAAVSAFPRADVFVAATADVSERPFPFKIKKFLAQQAGIPANRFIQVKSPFQATEITQMYDPDDTVLIFVRSEKDRQKPPQAGGVRRDGMPAYLQPFRRTGLEPMSKHGYMTYLPTVQFGPGMTSATEIRAKWPKMTKQERLSLVQMLYPTTAENVAAAGKIANILDEILGNTMQEALAGSQAQLMGAPQGSGAGGLNPSSTGMPNGVARRSSANRAGFREARLINDPEQGHLIVPDGGMGTWSEDTLRSNLARKFSDIAGMLQRKQYNSIYHNIYNAGTMQAMLQALQQYDRFMSKQGRRAIARGREIEMSDYLDEKIHT